MRMTLLIIVSLFINLSGFASGEGNFIESNLFDSMKPGDKAALLMVHFGTTYDDTRALTIDAINKKAKEIFGSSVELREAYTSRIIIRRLKAKGVEKMNPYEALKKLQEEGFTHILVQSTNIIEGVEMESLRRDVENIAHNFKDIRVGNPLLYSVKDYEEVAGILTTGMLRKYNGAKILVGHGTYTPSTATYAMMDYLLKAKGHKEYMVGTIEGYPSFDDVLAQLQKSGLKEVTLVPFMFVAGDHANNDIAVDWKEQLEDKGFKVNIFMEGLGQNPKIQAMFIEHALFIVKHKMINIMEKKKKYAKGDA